VIFWSPFGGRCEVSIPPAAFTAFRRQKALTGFGEIEEQLIRRRVENLRSDRNFDYQRSAVFPGPVRAFTVPASFCLVFGVVPKVKQGVQTLVRFQKDIATDAAVPARRTAAWDELLAAKGGNTVSAVAGFDVYLYAINKHGSILSNALRTPLVTTAMRMILSSAVRWVSA